MGKGLVVRVKGVSIHIRREQGFGKREDNECKWFVDCLQFGVSSFSTGGGDCPESLAGEKCRGSFVVILFFPQDGIYDMLQLQFEENSTRVAIIVTDAPPHGIGEPGDGEGCLFGRWFNGFS